MMSFLLRNFFLTAGAQKVTAGAQKVTAGAQNLTAGAHDSSLFLFRMASSKRRAIATVADPDRPEASAVPASAVPEWAEQCTIG